MQLPPSAVEAPSLIDAGQLDVALAQLSSALASEPGNSAVLIQLGRLALKADEGEQALSFFAEALLHDAACRDAVSERGHACLMEGQAVQACLILNLVEQGSARMSDARALAYLLYITQRFPRDYDPCYRQLLARLSALAAAGQAGYTQCAQVLQRLRDDLQRKAHLLELLFPQACQAHPDYAPAARLHGNLALLPSASAEVVAIPVEQLLTELLNTCARGDPTQGAPFAFLSRFYGLRDVLFAYFVSPSHAAAQDEIFKLCALQRQHWQNGYVGDYLYQGLARLGLSGIKPIEERLRRYGIERWLKATDEVLDIGANSGFLSLEIARHVAHIEGIEFNPYLVGMAHIAAQRLGVGNADFHIADFVAYQTEKRFDAIFSLANHCTIDGHLSMNFEHYIAKVFTLLKPGGLLFFETHNVFGPGLGGAGDDGDLDQKFDIAERYFAVLDSRMTACFVPAFDIDKLFVVLQKREAYQADAKRSFERAMAVTRYTDV